MPSARAPWVAASVTWTDRRLAADLTMPVPPGGRGEPFKGYVPPAGAGRLRPRWNCPGRSLAWAFRDLAAVWEARAELFRPEDVQNLAKLDTFAGQFFGGRDFGTGVLGAISSNWRLVVALQDHASLNPVPDVKLPAFALVVDLKPGDDDFAQRLRVAFQSFVGLANLGAAQTKAPPLELGSEVFDGVTISTSRFMSPGGSRAPGGGGSGGSRRQGPGAPPPQLQPVGRAGGRSLHHQLKRRAGPRPGQGARSAPRKPGDATLLAEADGAALARLVELNRNRMVMQNMLDKGHDKEQAEAEVGFLATLLRYFGRGRPLGPRRSAEATRVGLEFTLGR